MKTTSHLRELAYRVDPVQWVREVVGVTPTAWQEAFLRAPRGAHRRANGAASR
jgi:hypothetical protein